MAIEITARKREAQGTGPSRRLRNAGKVPGILYGGDQGPVNIELDHKDLFINLKNERFHASILTLELAGTKEQVLLRAVNMHPFKLQVQHVDFQRVVKDKKIHMKVPLHFVNAESSPGVKEQGGVVSHVLNELDVICLPDDLPEYIEVEPQGIQDRQQWRALEELLVIGAAVENHLGMLQKHGLVPKMGIGEWNGSDQRGERQDDRKRYPVRAASGQVSSVFTRVPGMVSASAELTASGPAIRRAAIAALTSCMLSHRPT